MAENSPHIGFIGAGQMATALTKGFLKNGGLTTEDISAADPHDSAQRKYFQATEISPMDSNVDLVLSSDVVFLAVKPQMINDVLEEIREYTPGKLVVSIAAGVTLGKLQEALGEETRLIRVMPNTPCLCGQGACAFCVSENVTEDDMTLIKKLLKSVGRCYMVDESKMDAVTGLSGSGPAYIYLIIEALSDAGVKEGLPRDVATSLAAQTVFGSAAMVIKTNDHPAVLKDKVTSPGGTTIAGMEQLEAGGVRAAIYAAVHAATERSKELGK